MCKCSSVFVCIQTYVHLERRTDRQAEIDCQRKRDRGRESDVCVWEGEGGDRDWRAVTEKETERDKCKYRESARARETGKERDD